MDLVVTGINFKTAPLEERERYSYSRDAARDTLLRLRDAIPNHEWLLLSTCNRTELYTGISRGTIDAARVASVFLANGGVLPAALQSHLYTKRGVQAVEHAMTVATSLDSLVVGETEILGQVKQAYNLAVESGTTGKILNSLLQHVLRVAKRVRSETVLSAGRVSIGSIAVDLAGKVFDDLSSKAVMIIGAGKIGEQTLKSLLARGVTESYVVNRSIIRGREIADRYGSIVVPYEKFGDVLHRADIVICSTSAPGCVVHVGPVRAAMKLRRSRPTLFVDLAVPRDIEDAVDDIDSVYLYNIDDLDMIAKENASKRRDAAAGAAEIVREEAAAVAAAMDAESLGIGDLMRRLDNSIIEIQEAEMARGFAKDKVAPQGEACDACREEICNMLHRALAKMAAGPKKALNQAVRDGRWEELAGFAAQLYGLDTSPKDSEPEDET